MTPVQPAVKMTKVEADTFESVGYGISNRRLYVKFKNAPTLCYEGVPSFRYQGLLSAPRKEAYFKTYIKNQFMGQPVPESPA
jgi:KTSC domain